MSDVMTTKEPRTEAEYQAAIDEMLAEIQRMNERMDASREEQIRLQQKTKETIARIDALMEDTDRMLQEMRSRHANRC